MSNSQSDNQNSQFEELDLLQEHLNKVKKYYWAAAIIFWVGVGMTMKYYISQTGTESSWIPGLVMFIGAGLYFVVRHLND